MGTNVTLPQRCMQNAWQGSQKRGGNRAGTVWEPRGNRTKRARQVGVSLQASFTFSGNRGGNRQQIPSMNIFSSKGGSRCPRLKAAGYRMQATGCRLQAAGYRLQATGHKLQVIKTVCCLYLGAVCANAFHHFLEKNSGRFFQQDRPQ